MKIIITNLPAFYKISLYNEINKHEKIFVIYFLTGSNDRNEDFYNGTMEFQHVTLTGSTYHKICELYRILHKYRYNELIINGWNKLIYWMCLLFSPKSRNSLILESSILESSHDKIKGVIKKIFLSRIKRVYASGTSHRNLLERLNYRGEILVTKGVGLKKELQKPEFSPKTSVNKFLYVGRFVEEKNLEFLIKQFNSHPELQLSLIGFGEQEQYLKSIAKDNIHFLGSIPNSDLPKFYQSADVFVLPSKSETWGLVIEEALNNGLPCFVSNKVGCAPDLIGEDYGIQFELNPEDFEDKLREITNIEKYNSLRYNVSKIDFDKLRSEQINCYINHND